ncbi:MAG: phage portal protein [Clostridia bacterium]|nr:phage portal protein [Clostridia bacterium]
MITYQEFLATYSNGLPTADGVEAVVKDHKASEEYRAALIADDYDRQRNTTITNFIKTVRTMTGAEVPDPFAANNKLPCNLFRRLNTQRNEYSLGNGVTFSEESVKEKFGDDFDTALQKAGYASHIHGVSFGFWNMDKLKCFRLTEFAPMYDEETGALMAGVRFWQLTDKHPLNMWLYTVEGIMRFVRKESGKPAEVRDNGFTPYVGIVVKTLADGEELIGGENYPTLPIVPLWGSELKQSTLIGLRNGIDSYDLIRSGLANDLNDAAFIYWIIKNADGMDDFDMGQFLNRLKSMHVVRAGNGTTTEGGESNAPEITPYTQDVPHEARTAYLALIKSGIYEDFGGLDVHTIAAGATNDHIDAAYQPLDENADDFEYQVIQFCQGIGALQGIDKADCTPQFKRNRVSNQMEQTTMILAAATYLDDETILKHLPFISNEEVDEIMKRRENADVERYRAQEEELNALKEETAQTPAVPPNETEAE